MLQRWPTPACLLAATLTVISSLGVAARAEMTGRPDTFVERLRALALMETLNADLLASRSATTTLEAWCGAHGMASPVVLKAQRAEGPDKPATPEQRERLRVGPDEALRYRSVQLSCGAHVLSVADNWYVPARLTAAMNTALETTDTSFGRVVASLKPTRRTYAAVVLWTPLPKGWEMHALPPDHPDAIMVVPTVLFEHRAVLYNEEQMPFSEVAEHYTSELLNFERP